MSRLSGPSLFAATRYVQACYVLLCLSLEVNVIAIPRPHSRTPVNLINRIQSLAANLMAHLVNGYRYLFSFQASLRWGCLVVYTRHFVSGLVRQVPWTFYRDPVGVVWPLLYSAELRRDRETNLEVLVRRPFEYGQLSEIFA